MRLTTEDITVTGGTKGTLSAPTTAGTGATMTTTYTLKVTPTTPYTDVVVSVAAGSVTDTAYQPNALAAAVTETWTAPVGAPSDLVGVSYGPTITIPANAFVVVVRDKNGATAEGLGFSRNVSIVEWNSMPDLYKLFDRNAPGGGGAIVLKQSVQQTTPLDVGKVGISEIMWAIDMGQASATAKAASQWIELHNLTANSVKVYLQTATGTTIINQTFGITGNLTSPIIDAVTNFFNGQRGVAAWDVPGASGNSTTAIDFVSMERILPHGKTAYADADGARYNDRDGRHKNHWRASTGNYLTARNSANQLYNYVGTPGAVNDFTPATQGDLVVSRTTVPSNTIVINEVGNHSDNRYDWIELRNVSNSGINLRNYMISIVTTKDTDNLLIQFDANDNAWVAGGDVFLLLASEPANDTNHPIAAGYNVDGAVQALGTARSPVQYKIFDGGERGTLTLPNADNGKFILIVRKPDNSEGQKSDADPGKRCC